MKHYKNLAGNSGVVAYETGADFIDVQFFDGGVYRYTYESAGPWNVEEMKRLAERGLGLSTFINASVHERFERR